MHHAIVAAIIVLSGLLLAGPGYAQGGAQPAAEQRAVFRDSLGTSLTFTRTGSEGRDLLIDIAGGAFNRNRTRLDGKDAKRFVAGLQAGEYQLSRTLEDGGLEFVTVQAGNAAKGDECLVSINSSRAGTMALGTFRCESLDEIARRVAALMSAAR
jgi:hypothetical protein